MVGPLVVLLILVVAGYGAWRYLKALPPSDATPVAATASPDAAAAPSTLASAPSAVAKPDQSKGSAQPASGSRGRGAPSVSGGRVAQNPPAAASAPAGPGTQPGASNSLPVAASTDPERVSSSSGPPASINSEIYSTASVGVKAPVLITPGANTPLLTTARHPAGTPGIEIIINPDGFVASVKAVTKPTSLAESLEYHNGLSVAKSWQFQPAMRDGQPVSYKIFMPLAILRNRGAIK